MTGRRGIRRLLPGVVRRSYGVKLTLALLAIVVVTASVGAVVHIQTSQQLQADVRADLQEDATQRASEMDTWLNSIRLQTKTSSDHPVFRSGNENMINAYLRQQVSSGNVPEGVVALHYLDIQEMRILTSSNEDFVGVSPAERGVPFAENPPEFDYPDETYVSVPFTLPMVDHHVVAVISPVASQPGTALIYMVNLETKTGSFAGDGGEFTAILDGEGTYMAHPDPGVIGSQNPGGASNPALQQALAGETAFEDAGDVRLSGYAPMETNDWVVVSTVPRAQAYALGTDVTRSILVLIGLVVLAVGLVGVTAGRSTVRALRGLSTRADEIANGDLDVELETTREDELGRLVDSFDRMRNSLRERIADAQAATEAAEESQSDAEAARREAERLASQLEAKATDYESVMRDVAGGDLTRRVDPDSDNEAMRAIGHAFNDMVGEIETTVGDVSTFADHVSAAADQTEASTDAVQEAGMEVTGSVEEIADGAQRQSERLRSVAGEMDSLSASSEEVAATVEEVATTSREAAEAGEEGREAAETAVEEIDAVQSETDQTMAELETLHEEVAAVGDIVEVISDVADQTNLLALNASIEAARAGEEGNGFAVVAEEVKNLAEETRTSAAEIETRLDAIRERTEATVEDMAGTADRVETGVETVEDAIDELERIADYVDETDAKVQEIRDATDQQARSAQAVVGMVDDVAAIGEQTSDEADVAAAAAQEQTATLSEVSAAAADLSARTGQLYDLLDAFTVGRGEPGGSDGANGTNRDGFQWASESPTVADDD